MKFIIIAYFVFIFCSIEAFAKPIPFMTSPEIGVEKTIAHLACRPLLISSTGPISKNPLKAKEIAITYGPYRFVRTDIGSPDGELKFYINQRLTCHLETSILSGIQIEPKNKVLLVKWNSGSGSNWELFKFGERCESLGYVADKNLSEFESKMTSLRASD